MTTDGYAPYSSSLGGEDILTSADLACLIRKTSFKDCSVTLIGYGFMGRHYMRALSSLGVGNINVCSRSPVPLEEVKGIPGVHVSDGGVENVQAAISNSDLAIIATPSTTLVEMAEHLLKLGYKRLLIEKPVAFESAVIDGLAAMCKSHDVDAFVAFNRIAYPSFIEARSRVYNDGGISSCSYTITELVSDDWPKLYPPTELARWGISNTLHVVSMAHGLIGWPYEWNSICAGSMEWHKTGSVFVGSGISDKNIPFSYHGDWKSRGRWSIELHTVGTSYRFCPLETLCIKHDALADWEDLHLEVFDKTLKAGIAEQVAAALDSSIGRSLPLMTLRDAVSLAQYGENMFGYEAL